MDQVNNIVNVARGSVQIVIYLSVILHAQAGSKYKFVYKIAGLLLLYSAAWTYSYSCWLSKNQSSEKNLHLVAFFISDSSFAVA